MEPSAPGRPAAPAVVAVVVSRNPGTWFEEALAALGAQDYSNLAVLVIDAASDADPTPRVAAVLPRAYVRILDRNPGFGAAANEVLEIVDGASFFLFCHDDAAPMPDAVSTMVGEAVRSNAGIVGPKLVHWDDPGRILQVGELVDKTGERAPLVERGELDQEQHDAVRDVFVVPGACTLVRADLFTAIGGFDAGIDLLNDDLDLCWRAHVAGARVVVAPDAVVRHQEALGDRVPVEQRRHRLVRHRLRTVLSVYGRWHLLRVVPQALLVGVVEVLYSLAAGQRGHAGDIVGAWRWNLSRRGEIAARRAQVAALRRVPDHEIRRLQVRGSARLAAFLRGQIGYGSERTDVAAAVRRTVADVVRDPRYRWPAAAWALTLLIIAFGSRHLLTQSVPAVSGLPPFDRSAGDLLRAYASGWRDVGLGAESPAPTAFALLGLLGTLFLGAMGLLRQVLLLGPVVLGLAGVHRLLRPVDSPRAQAVAVVLYGAAPLAYDGISAARWGELAVYAAAPWLLGSLARAGGWAPFGGIGGRRGPRVAPHRPVPRVAAIGLLTAVTAAVEPAVVVVVVLVALGLLLAGPLVGQTRGLARLAAGAGGGLVVAFLLHVPWSLDFVLPGATWTMVVGQRGGAADPSLLELLRFHVGPVGGAAVALGLPLAAALPLLIGRDWRFDWAVRAWVVALVCIGAAWAGTERWLPFDLPSPVVLLAPAAAAFALSAALGLVAFELDLRGYHFGWRQLATAGAGVALLVGAVPTLLDAGDGRWYLPTGGLDRSFAFLGDEEPGFRVLWVGHPDVLPLPGFRYSDDLAYATTDDGLPSLGDSWPGSPAGATELLRDALQLAAAGDTSRLGRLLAPMAVRYLVVPLESAPEPLDGIARPAPDALLATLDAQLDLARVPVNPAYVVFRNQVALPARARVAPTAGDGTAFAVDAADLAGAEAVLPRRTGATGFSGALEADSRILHSVGAADGWELSVGGAEARRVKLFGWAEGYDITAGGPANLRYRTAPLRYVVIAVQLALWLLALRLVVSGRARRADDPRVSQGRRRGDDGLLRRPRSRSAAAPADAGAAASASTDRLLAVDRGAP